MISDERFDLLKSERILRIGQQGTRAFDSQPPEQFRTAIIDCVVQWEADQHVRHSPRELIYHYCDANALLNILKYRTTWATSTKYLNDTTELLSFSANFKAHALRHRSSDAEEVLSDIIDFYRITTDTKQTQTIGGDRFACCFSDIGDLLSQWRAYGNNGRGYAIGFDPQHIAGLTAANSTMSLRRISYTEDDEARLVADLFARFEPVVAENLSILDNTGWGRQSARNWLSMRFGECLFELVEEMKHPAFSEERELRLYAGGGQATQFRVSEDRIVPFKQLDMSSSLNPNLLPIEEIVIGPRLDFDEAVVSLTTYTSTLGYGTSMNFRKSNAPYR